MKQPNVIFISDTHEMNDYLIAQVKIERVNILSCVTLDEVQHVFDEQSIDLVLLGTSPELLASRLQIIEYIKMGTYSAGQGPSIHFVGSSDPVLFVNALLESKLLGE
jgi:hypothetical protein